MVDWSLLSVEINGINIALFVLICLSNLLFLGYVVYRYLTRNFGYLEKQGIPVISKPVPFLGTRTITAQKPVHELDCEAYIKFGMIFGAYEGNVPVLYVAEPLLLKKLFVEEFNSFSLDSHMVFPDQCHSMIKLGDTQCQNHHWNSLRHSLRRVFGFENLKHMIPPLHSITDQLISNIREFPDSEIGKVVDVYELASGFTIDVVANLCFGLRLNSVKEPKHAFYLHAKELIDPCALDTWTATCVPKCIRKLVCSNFNYEYFINLATETILKRKKSDQYHNDILSLLLEEQEAEIQKSYRVSTVKQSHKAFDDHLIVTHLMMILLTMVNTTTSALTFLLYALAMNPHVHQRLENEVHRALHENEGFFNSTLMMKLHYMELVIAESLRMFPPIARSEWQCKRDCRLRRCALREGMKVHIPIYAIHHDSKVYPQPEAFMPERFVNSRKLFLSYLPFGIGPRKCIGKSFSYILMKIFLICIVDEFKVIPVPDTKSFTYRLGSTILKPSSELWLGFRERTLSTNLVPIMVHDHDNEDRRRKSLTFVS